MKLCTIEGCTSERDRCSKSYCTRHKRQIQRYGKVQEINLWTPNEFIIEGDICKIGLRNSKLETIAYAIIDADQVDKVRKYKWGIAAGGYVCCGSYNIFLHKKVYPVEGQIDHINRDLLDCRLSNLRLATTSQNMANTPAHRNNVSGIKGVSWSMKAQKWITSIRCKGINYYLGGYNCRLAAMWTWNIKAKELFGEFAFQNTLDNIKVVPSPKFIPKGLKL